MKRLTPQQLRKLMRLIDRLTDAASDDGEFATDGTLKEYERATKALDKYLKALGGDDK